MSQESHEDRVARMRIAQSMSEIVTHPSPVPTRWPEPRTPTHPDVALANACLGAPPQTFRVVVRGRARQVLLTEAKIWAQRGYAIAQLTGEAVPGMDPYVEQAS